MTDILTIAKNHQLAILRETISNLESFEQTMDIHKISFNLNHVLNDSDLKELAKSLPIKGKFIYYFTTNQQLEVSNLFREFIAIKTDIKFARYNGHELEKCQSLYVGSSSSLRKRFREHCGLSSKQTYALKFRNWMTADNVEIQFHYFQLSNVTQDILQNIEDGLWKTMLPVFGKLGGK